jgi:histone H3/H4
MSEQQLHASTTEERDIRAALQYAVAQICMEEEMSDASTHMSSQAVAALSELVYQYSTKCLSNDLIAFAKHASRRTITLDDVQLVARKDPEGLQCKLVSFAKREKLSSGKKETKRDSPPAVAATPVTERMRAFQERLKKGIDSSDSATDTDEEMNDKPQANTNKQAVPFAYSVDDYSDEQDLGKGKENLKMQPLNTSKTEEDPFASSEDEKEALTLGKQVKNAAVAKVFPGGTKTALSSDESDDNMFE